MDTDYEQQHKEEIARIYEDGIRQLDAIVATYKEQMKEHIETFRRQRIEQLQKELQQ